MSINVHLLTTRPQPSLKVESSNVEFFPQITYFEPQLKICDLRLGISLSPISEFLIIVSSLDQNSSTRYWLATARDDNQCKFDCPLNFLVMMTRCQDDEMFCHATVS
jgi:hypothetical protein